MTLHEYLEHKYPDLSIGRACAKFAEKVETTRQAIDRYRTYARYPVPEMIVKIENATGGLVTATDHLPPKLAAQRVAGSRSKKGASRR